MYLSRVVLNTDRLETMRAIASPQLLHGAVETSFNTNRIGINRNLWRIDWLGGICYLLILSKDRPDLKHVVKQFGYTEKSHQWESKNYKLFLERLRIGDTWGFRLRANPTRSSKNEKQKTDRGKVFAHVTQEQQRQWLLQRAQKNGFSLEENQFDVVHTDWKRFSKGKSKVTLRTATYEGILTIQDKDKFKEKLLNGIGRGKAYGCGLLTIARPRG